MKNHHTYPIFLDMRDVPCLVVGGGMVATRKVVSLLEAAAMVTVVSLNPVTSKLATLAIKNKIILETKPYSSACLKGMRLVIAATNNADVNHKVFNDAEKQGVIVNVVDDVEYCRFVVPARFCSGDLEVAVTTGGAAPSISKVIRDKIAILLGDQYAVFIKELAKRRERIKKLSLEEKKLFWNTVVKLATVKKVKTISMVKTIDNILKKAEGSAL